MRRGRTSLGDPPQASAPQAPSAVWPRSRSSAQWRRSLLAWMGTPARSSAPGAPSSTTALPRSSRQLHGRPRA
eukprot:14917500-Alexandrium_andersonii.AAC.1